MPVLVHVHLLVEGVPIGALGAVGELYHQHGQAGLAEEHVLDVLLPGNQHALFVQLAAAFPELVPVDEEILIGGGVPFFHQVLELGRLDGQVVQDEVQLQVDAHVLEGLQVLLCGDHPVDAVVDDGEAPVQVGVEQAGENVEGGKGPLYRVFLEKAPPPSERVPPRLSG